MKSLFKYFKGYGKECILGPLFKLLEASFELFVPLVIAGIIDEGLPSLAHGDNSLIIRDFIILIALAVIGLACSLTAQYFSAKAATGFAAKVREGLFAHIQSFSYSDIDNVGTATMITRMTSDINQLQSGVNMTLRLFLRSPFIVFGAMIMAFTIDKKMALIFLVTIILLSIVVYGVMIITIPKQRAVQGGLDKVLSRTRDNLTGVRVLRAFRKEESERRNFEEENNRLAAMQLASGRISALTNPVTYIIINGAIIYLIWKGALVVSMGFLSAGQVVALYNYMSQILVELIKLANFIVLDIKALACARRIEEVLLSGGSDINNGQLAKEIHPIAVEFKNVSMKYNKSSKETLEDISFSVNPGETIGIIGGTGSGKSSVVNLIAGFYKQSAGEILLDGHAISEYSVDYLRNTIGITLQKAVLFAGTIGENIRWGCESATDDEVYKALDMACALEFVKEKEGCLDYKLTSGGKNLSGGQRQRLTIARSLVGKRGILIFDDSSSALDALTDAKLRENLKSMEDAPTIFMVSQRASTIMHADKILVLDDGKMVAFDNHNNLMENCEVYREIYESQFPPEDGEV